MHFLRDKLGVMFLWVSVPTPSVILSLWFYGKLEKCHVLYVHSDISVIVSYLL